MSTTDLSGSMRFCQKVSYRGIVGGSDMGWAGDRVGGDGEGGDGEGWRSREAHRCVVVVFISKRGDRRCEIIKDGVCVGGGGEKREGGV